MAALSPEELRRIDAWWRAANYLSVGQIYLLDNPLLREPLAPRARQAPAARALGHHPRAELRLRPPQPRHPRPRPRGHLRDRPRPRRARARGQRLSGRHLQRGLSAHRPRRRRHARSCSASSPSRAASPATSPPRPPARSTRAASSATRSRTPTGPRSTTPTCSCAAWSATARPRPGRWRPAGTRTSSSTRWATGPCSRYCTSTATRSPTRPSSRASRATSFASLLEGYGYAPRFLEGSEPEAMHEGMAALLDEVMDEIASIQQRRSRRQNRWTPALADDRPRHAEGLDGPARGRWRAHGGHVPRPPGSARGACRPPRAPRPCSSSGCAATGPRSSSTSAAPPGASCWPHRPTGERRMSANPHTNGGLLLRDLNLPDWRDYGVDVPAAGDDVLGGHARARDLVARRRARSTPTSATSASSAPTRRCPTGSTRSSRPPSASGKQPSRTTTSTWPATAA